MSIFFCPESALFVFLPQCSNSLDTLRLLTPKLIEHLLMALLKGMVYCIFTIFCMLLHMKTCPALAPKAYLSSGLMLHILKTSGRTRIVFAFQIVFTI